MPRLVLNGEHELVIDEKNRLMIPSEIREKMDPERDANSFYLLEGQNGRIWLYFKRYYEETVLEQEPELTPADVELDFAHAYYAMASYLTLDGQGRLRIPELAFRESALNREITLIGSIDHLELWNREDWKVRRADLRKRRPEIINQRKQSKKKPPGGGDGQATGDSTSQA